MDNNLKKIEKDLRAFAKRCKDIKYTQILLFVFLLTGLLSLAAPADSVETARRDLNTSITDMKKLFKEAKQENNKLMKGSNLELIQLMEQGDHVVKSPWSSWQYGMNYFYSDWRGTYKGRGDKKEKYPYEGVLERDSNLFNRYVPTNSANYSLLSATSNAKSAATNSRNGLKGYGLASNKPVPEPPVEIQVSAGIRPKSINKIPLNIAAKTANTPTLPEAVKFAPIDPTIVIPANPALPAPPSFKVIVGADCNSADGRGCSGHATPVLRGTEGTDGYEYLHYTWPSGNYEGEKLAFKWFDAVVSGTKIYGDGSALGAATTVTVGTDTFTGTSRTSGTTISTNSYHDFTTALASSTNASPVNRNNQYFLVGGSRAIEADMAGGGGAIINKGTVNLGGILTLGMVTQTSSSTNHVINDGTITDANEKNDAYVQNVRNVYNTDTDSDGVNDALRIYGPSTEVYDVKVSDDGYVGYKIGMAVVPENTGTDKSIIKNTGNINFYGAN